MDTWDPKQGRPVQGEFSAIDTSADGIQISSIFPNLAKQMHHCALVRSIAGTNGAHGRATYELQTSYNMDPSLIHPGLGSIVVHEKIGSEICRHSSPSTVRRPSPVTLVRAVPHTLSVNRERRIPTFSFPTGITNARGNKRLDMLARMNACATGKTGVTDFKATDTAIKEAVSLDEEPGPQGVRPRQGKAGYAGPVR